MDCVVSLLDEARKAGLVVCVEGDRLVVEGPKSAEPIARRLLDRKPEVVAALADRTCSQFQAEEPVDWWQHITDEHREYLLGPEVDDPPTSQQLAKLRGWHADRHPGKCFFCGGRRVHSPDCFIVSFKSVLPFGRYKGRQVSEVPRDYLLWLLENSTRLGSDLRVDIERVIQKKKSGPGVLQSAGKSILMNEPPGCVNTRAALTTTQPCTGGPRHG